LALERGVEVGNDAHIPLSVRWHPQRLRRGAVFAPSAERALLELVWIGRRL